MTAVRIASKRALQWGAGALVLALSYPIVSQAQGSPLGEGIGLYRTLFEGAPENGDGCFRIPALVTAPNGDLLVAVDERVPSCADLRGNPDINIVLRRSPDGGVSWSEVDAVTDLPAGESASDPSMIVDRETGRVWMFYNVMDLGAAPNVYRFHAKWSDDSGASWSEAVDLTPQLADLSWEEDFMFITSGRGIQTRDGTLLHTLVNLDKGLHLFGSDDHGATWSRIGEPMSPGDESKVVELADGRWMVNSRVSNAGMRYVHVTADAGQTWQTRPEPVLVDPASNASLVRHSTSGGACERLLFVNANSPDRRENLTVRWSADEGESWSGGRTLYSGASAYSTMTILEDGDIGVVFEKDDYYEIAFIRFAFDEDC